MSDEQDRFPPGKWVRSFGSRYWEGACTCGSGLEGHELYDKKGIYAGITCRSCRKEDTFAPGVMPGSPYDYPDDIGPIEPEDY